MLHVRALALGLCLSSLVVAGADGQTVTLKPSASPSIGIVSVPPTGTTMNGLVAKASPGNLYSFVASTGSVSGCFFLFNSTTVPSTGAVTFGNASGNVPLPPIPVQANAITSFDAAPGPPSVFSVGITIGYSSTCGGTFTQSATASIAAWVQ